MNQMDSIIEDLYSDNGCKLHKLCQKEMARFGGISQKDYDDFYSRVGYEITKARESYDSFHGKSFKDYIFGVIKFSIQKEMTYKNRSKRQNFIESEEEDEYGNLIKKKEYITDISLDTPIDEENGLCIGDILPSSFDLDNVLAEKLGDFYSDNVKNYLEHLPEMPRKVAKLIMKGYKRDDIKRILNITEKQYIQCFTVMKLYENKRILYQEKREIVMEEEEMNTMLEQDVIEDYKNTSYSIESISKQLNRKRLRDDHILQRHSGQWKKFAKSELIADILRGKSLTQIIICEEIKDGLRMQWLIDGKQRCTTLDDFLHDGFSISKNVKNYNIKYQTPRIDEVGNEILNEDGFIVMEWKIFDMRGKKFSQLPEELQDVFKDRQIPVLYETNCSKRDIAEDIARFNRNRPMNKAQNGWLELEEGFAELVDSIAKMPFFQPEFVGSSYTRTNNTSGAIRRIIVESVMVSDFIEDFCDFNHICVFLSEEASDSNFTEFYSLVERLTEICKTEKSAELFNTKDSFLWFGLFSRFSKLNIEDKRFRDFMDDFTSLRKLKMKGKSFNDILDESKSTKEKSIVIKKINHLEMLMMKYFNMKGGEGTKYKNIEYYTYERGI
ncbi:MAG: hypothetical protein HFH73_03525 [Lachnospiraceae bacterium]|nr:hypothetical protein [Lachnospiraceae bacterium]